VQAKASGLDVQLRGDIGLLGRAEVELGVAGDFGEVG
jgi:hypothetical protein